MKIYQHAPLVLSVMALLGQSACKRRLTSDVKYENEYKPRASANNLQDIDQVAAIAKATDSVEAFLKHLSTKHPSYLKDHTLVYKSQSIQHASPDTPRVILFGDRGTLMMAYEGNASSQQIEVIAFDEKKNKFTPFEITFPNGKGIVTQPKRCSVCHGEDFRPIWDDYPTWAGVYEREDHEVNEKESALYQKFRFKHKNTDRYKILDVAEKIDDRAEKNSLLSELITEYNLKRILVNFSKRPAFPKLKYLMARVLAQCDFNIYSLKDFKPSDNMDFKYELPKNLQNTLSFHKLFLRTAGEMKFAELIKHARKDKPVSDDFPPELTKEAWQDLKNPSGMDDMYHHLQDAFYLAQIRYLADLAGLPYYNWSPAHSYFSAQFGSPSQGLEMIVFAFIDLFYQDADLKEFLHRDKSKIDCSQKLKEKSINALKDLRIDPPRYSPNADKESDAKRFEDHAPLVRCMSCHVLPTQFSADEKHRDEIRDGAPPIPFDNVTELKTYLGTNNNWKALLSRLNKDADIFKMPPPPHRELTSSEKEAFKDFVEFLVEKK